ncbi:hypothetical protein M8J77_010037 [Diaphorina citri]|nr:hypothetical protein M8J77_010037 [Diaphorina citri]
MVSNKRYGVGRDNLITFYKSYVLPIFDYGCVIYGSAKDYILKKLNPVHNAGIRIATGALRSSPVTSLHVESCILPLSLRRSKLLMNYVSKIGSSPFNPMHKELFSVNRELVNHPPNKPKPLSLRVADIPEFMDYVNASEFAPYQKHIPPWSLDVPIIESSLHIDKKSNISPLVFRKHFLDVISSKYSDRIVCFTDGSKSENSTSCAYTIGKNLCAVRLNNVNSVFSAELMGILLCIQNMKYLPPTKFLLVSDSMSALQALSNYNCNNSLLSKIYNRWIELKSYGKDIIFMWCPSHCGIDGNEVVDNATRNPNPLLQPLKLCSATDFKPIIDKIIISKWQNSWDSLSLGNKLKAIKPKIEKWQSSSRQTRFEEIVLTRMRIGHTRLTHSYLFTRSPQPSCRCGEILTVKHILSCPLDVQLRSLLPDPPSLSDDKAGVDALMSLLRSLKIIDKI